MTRWGLFALFCLAAGAVAEDQLPKVEAKKQPLPAGVAPALQKLLAPGSFHVGTPGKELMTVWLSASVPASADAEPVPYAAVTEGTLIGILEIKDKELTDFRKQALHPGVYTLRLGFQPQDGNHMGVAPSTEFLCLVPVALDTEIEPIAHKKLMGLSKKASRTGHPCVLYLQPPEGKPEKLPQIGSNDAEHVLLHLGTKAQGKAKALDFALSIVIVGTTNAE